MTAIEEVEAERPVVDGVELREDLQRVLVERGLLAGAEIEDPALGGEGRVVRRDPAVDAPHHQEGGS